MTDIKFIKEEEFAKMTKKQKLEMEEHSPDIRPGVQIDNLVMIPLSAKSSGYLTGAFFAHTPKKGWWRSHNYDCWSIRTEFHNPATPRLEILRGDFEHNGINIFTFVDKHHIAYLRYGGEILIEPKLS